MKENKLNRILALVLAASMILSDAPVSVLASGNAELPTYCGVEEHTHTDECYVNLDTEPTEETIVTEETTEATEAPEVTEATEAPTEATEVTEAPTEETKAVEETESVEETEAVVEETEPERTLMDQLMTTQSLKDLYDLILENEEEMESLSLGEVSAVKYQAKTLYDALETPTQKEEGYYAQIAEIVSTLLGENKPVTAATGISGSLNVNELENGGEYRLDGNASLDKMIDLGYGKTLTIDLNGFTLTVANGTQFASVSGTLIIQDNSTSHQGTITGTGNSEKWGGAICVEEGGTLYFHGGTITGFQAECGGAIHSSGTFYMHGGTITGNTATEDGGGVSARDKFFMYGGTISNNTAPNGGGIAIHGNEAQITGGTISNNTATSNGGGIYSYKNQWAGANPTLSITGGTISNNTATNGGGIYNAQEGTLTLSSGTASDNAKTIVTISNNTATSNGGGIYNANRLTITDGTISNNTATTSGGGIYNTGISYTVNNVVYAGFTMSGGTISGNKTTTYIYRDYTLGGGGIYNSGTFTLDNGTISGNTTQSHGGGVYTIGTFTMNNGTIFGNETKKDSGNHDDKKPKYSSNSWGGGVFIYTSNGKFTMNNGTIKQNISASGGGVMAWNSSTFTMYGGTIGGDTEADGNKAYGTGGPGNGGAVYVQAATFNFYAGTLKNNWARRYGGAININETAHLNMYGTGECIIENNIADNGGGISQEAGNCTMAITSDNIKIKNNKAIINTAATAVSHGCGGGLFIEKGTLTISKGLISGNEAAMGGGIALRAERVNGDITFIMTGGTVKENKATATGGAIDVFGGYDKGNPPSSNKNDIKVYLEGGTFEGNKSGFDSNGNSLSSGDRTGGAIDIFANETYATANMYIGGGKPDKASSDPSKDYTTIEGEGPTLSYNQASQNGGAIRVRNGNVYLIKGTVHSNTAHNNGGGICVNGGNFYIKGGELYSNVAQVNGGGAYVTGGNFDMTGGQVGSLTGGEITVSTIHAKKGGGIYVNGGNATISGGVIQYNVVAEDGGGIYVDGSADNGNVTVSDAGAIQYNVAKGNGGGAYINGGKFFLNGGRIGAEPAEGTPDTKLHAKNGGGIYINGGEATITDGIIYYNNAEKGGGAYINNGTLTLKGEKAHISYNTATEDGAGFYLTGDSSVPYLLQGSVQYNNATGNGGGIYLDQKELYLDPQGDIDITNNTAANGGGIYIGGSQSNPAIFSVNSETQYEVTITDNEVTGNGGAVCIYMGEFILDSQKIILQRNKASDGGAVAVLSGSFIMSTGTISNNTAKSGNGGGVLVSDGIFKMYDGNVDSNEALKGNGGGISVSEGEVIIAGGSVSNNTAKQNGGGIYISGSDKVPVKIFSGNLLGNTAGLSGGAVAVYGGENSEISVQIGLNLQHKIDENTLQLTEYINHDDNGELANTNPEFIHTYCPEIKNNTSQNSGGAFYITGGKSTKLNIFCLMEDNNQTAMDENNPDADINAWGEVLSKFMMVEGGVVVISSAEVLDKEDHEDTYGNFSELSSVHVFAGELTLDGTMDNPSFKEAITVDYRNESDKFDDLRYSETKFKLVYHENFQNPDGSWNSQVKSYDIDKGDEAIIAELMFNHPGYTIKHWNTAKDDTGDVYRPGDKYIFIFKESEKEDYKLSNGQEYHIGDLILYAIWEINGYEVQYIKNIPDNVTHSGTMANQKFAYDQEQALTKNDFVYPGYSFAGWSYTTDEGQSATLTDEQVVKNLTLVKGKTVLLTAIWEECTHPADQITYTASGATITKTCEQCKLSATATIEAQDGTYDGVTQYRYQIKYTNEAFFGDDLTIGCTATKINSTESVDSSKMFINAGNYTVTATATAPSGAVATLTYTVKKANQPAPELIPAYQTPDKGSKNVTIQQNQQELYSPKSGALIEYAVKYYDDQNNLITSDWHSDATGSDVSITLDHALTTYYVYSRYQETDNYLASPDRVAQSAFFFSGNIVIQIIPTPGISFQPPENGANSLNLQLYLLDGYYLVDSNFHVVTKEGNDGYILINNKSDSDVTAEDGKFAITATDKPVPTGTTATIILEVGTANKTTSVTGKVKEKQVFGDVTGTEATISRDSAYTALFEVTDFDSSTYTNPSLSFSQNLPVGTKIILRDKTILTGESRELILANTYWSYEVLDKTSSIPLTSFIRMGGSDSFGTYETVIVNDKEETNFQSYHQQTNWRLQFVVDFSQVEAEALLPVGDLETWLGMTKKDSAPANAPLFNGIAKVTTKLESTGFDLKYTKTDGLTQALDYDFQGTAAASKWDYRDLALVLIPETPLPADAKVSASINAQTAEYRPKGINFNGQDTTGFLISLSNFSGTVELTLISNLISKSEYKMTAHLVAAQSISQLAPVNGTILDTEEEVTFSTKLEDMAIKIKEASDKRLIHYGDTMNFTIQLRPATLPTGYEFTVNLERKDEGGEYTFYGVSYTGDVKGSSNTRTLDATILQQPGSYRMRVFITKKDPGALIMETFYYFIIE